MGCIETFRFKPCFVLMTKFQDNYVYAHLYTTFVKKTVIQSFFLSRAQSLPLLKENAVLTVPIINILVIYLSANVILGKNFYDSLKVLSNGTERGGGCEWYQSIGI